MWLNMAGALQRVGSSIGEHRFRPWALVEQRNWVRFAKASRPAFSASALPASEGARLVRRRSLDAAGGLRGAR
jgi:hypothetical protein